MDDCHFWIKLNTNVFLPLYNVFALIILPCPAAYSKRKPSIDHDQNGN